MVFHNIIQFWINLRLNVIKTVHLGIWYLPSLMLITTIVFTFGCYNIPYMKLPLHSSVKL